MRLVAIDLQPFQRDVAATSSIPSLVPKTSLVPKISSYRIATIAFAWERSTIWLGNLHRHLL